MKIWDSVYIYYTEYKFSPLKLSENVFKQFLALKFNFHKKMIKLEIVVLGAPIWQGFTPLFWHVKFCFEK